MDWNQVPCGGMDKACVMLAKSLCGVGGTRFESVCRALIFLYENIYNTFTSTAMSFFIHNFKF